MIGHESTHRRNLALFILISIFYLIQILINIFIEGLASIFPPAFLFIVFVYHPRTDDSQKDKPRDYHVCDD